MPNRSSSVVSLVYCENTLVLKCVSATEASKIRMMLNSKLFIHVSLSLHTQDGYFIGWNEKIQGRLSAMFP